MVLQSAASRQTHGNAGIFDIDLPLTGTRGVECRTKLVPGSSPPSLSYTIVFTFTNNLVSVGPFFSQDAPTVSCGTPDPNTSGIGPNANQYTLNFTFLQGNIPFEQCNSQYITATLKNVNDAAGNHSDTVSVTMGLLIGDSSANTLVNSTDISQVQSQSGNVLNSTNFRRDISANGLINSTDVTIVQAHSGTGLPPP